MKAFKFFISLFFLVSCSHQEILISRDPSSDSSCGLAIEKFIDKSSAETADSTFELPVPFIKDQCQWGSCWVHSPLERLEINFQKKYNEPLELSTDYFYANYLLSQFASEVYGMSKFEEGNYTNFFNAYSKEFGIVPKNKFKNKTSIHSDSKKSNQFYDYIHQKVIELQKLKQDQKARLALLDEVKNKFETEFNISDFEFDFKGEHLDPKEFQDKYFPEVEDRMRVYSFKEYKNNFLKIGSQKKELLVYSKGKFKKINFSFQSEAISESDMQKLILTKLEEGSPVPVEVQWPYDREYTLNGKKVAYIDYDTGLMTASSRPVDFESSMSHAVLIVGVKLKDNQIVSFKILNSYGEKSGKGGFYEMDLNYFRKFLIHLYL